MKNLFECNRVLGVFTAYLSNVNRVIQGYNKEGLILFPDRPNPDRPNPNRLPCSRQKQRNVARES